MSRKTETLKTVDEIAEFFAAFPGLGMQVWSFSISHSMLDFAISHKKKAPVEFWGKRPPEYATMLCHMTNSMNIPAIAFNARLRIAETGGSDGRTTVTITDEDSAFCVNCDHVYVTLGRHPNEHGTPLPEKIDT